MTHTKDAYIPVGKIGSAYGVRGWLKVLSYTEFGANILDYAPWYIETGKDQWQEIEVEDGRIHGNGIVAKLAGMNSPEEARLFTGKLIAIKRSQLPALENDEYYWSDLVNLTVINKDGTILGKVAYLMATGSNDVLVIKGEKEHAIPFLLNSVIKKVDLEKQEIYVDWELI
jgi:16S rRNA processing protein RimM